jgi:hypothetical protein
VFRSTRRAERADGTRFDRGAGRRRLPTPPTWGLGLIADLFGADVAVATAAALLAAAAFLFARYAPETRL